MLIDRNTWKPAHALTIGLIVILATNVVSINGGGILYPRESESREVKSLDGIWSFRLDGAQGLQDPETGFKEAWYMEPLSQVSLLTPILPFAINYVLRMGDIKNCSFLLTEA